ncbi:hypothetical protein MVEN_01291000 [Mycena venus]|uniref:Transmembrane protein n=1 Tax=Mycena venus TaxID=2733690 RepID=A0A8H7CWI2_9AGAR|nr:hypothetical protein MVEN_01291000 [Mycena venus]
MYIRCPQFLRVTRHWPTFTISRLLCFFQGCLSNLHKMVGAMPGKLTTLAKIMYSGFCDSLLVLGFAAYIVAHYDTKAIGIAHIVLSIITMIFVILSPYAYRDDPSACSGLFMLNAVIYLVLMIVMVADPHTRQQADSQGQNYFSGNQTENVKRTVLKAALTIGFGSGAFLGLLIADCLGIMINALGICAARG